jgi:hypothetical protein
MVRAVLDEGVIRPLETLPEHWADGQELVIQEATDRPSPEDLATWDREVEALAAGIPPEDFERLEAALAEADREAKESVRRQMALT